MIELTPEQWQAIAQEENPTVIEPDSKTLYVIIPKEEHENLRPDEAYAAHHLRIAWMRRVGLDEEEIAESLRDEPPTSIQQEIKEMKALDWLDKNTPSGEVLRQFAIKY